MFKSAISLLGLGLIYLARAQNATTQKIGWTGTLSSLDGGLGGVVTVTNATTLTISDYTLKDASAPALYWWGTTNGVLADGFRISNTHITQAATSNMDTINLDAGKTTAAFNTVGLWCEQLKANFGQATLAEAGAGTSAASAGSTMSSTGSAPAATSLKSSTDSVGVPYSALAMTLLAATVFAIKMG
jgi:hypothetical protein